MSLSIHTNGTTAHETDYSLDQLYAWWPPTPPAAPALPEARASANVSLLIQGQRCQITLRDHDEQALLTRLEALLQRYPQPQAQSGTPESGWCSTHGVQMQQNHKNGRSWWSHATAEGWCKGR
jgi:hypothetical protein